MDPTSCPVCSVDPDLVEVVVGSLDVKWIVPRRLLPAAVTGTGGAPPAVVVHDGRIVVQVRLLACRNYINLGGKLLIEL